MPIEIRELVIRAIVDPAAGTRGHADGRAGDASDRPPARDDIVQACVAEVMNRLRRAGEP